VQNAVNACAFIFSAAIALDRFSLRFIVAAQNVIVLGRSRFFRNKRTREYTHQRRNPSRDMRVTVAAAAIALALLGVVAAAQASTSAAAAGSTVAVSSSAAPTSAGNATPAPPLIPSNSSASTPISIDQFGVTAITFFSAMAAWFLLCFIMAKWEDSQSDKAADSAAPVAGAAGADNKAGVYAAPSAAPGGSETASSSGGYSADAGYMPVSIPGAPRI
jgi:hypothetical protein